MHSEKLLFHAAGDDRKSEESHSAAVYWKQIKGMSVFDELGTMNGTIKEFGHWIRKAYQHTDRWCLFLCVA